MNDYTKIFNPPLVPEPSAREHVADRADVTAYVYDESLILAVNVALVTGRPLLLRGRPGTGKSSVARNIAWHLKRRFYPTTVSSRTQARDLLWTVDDVARLSDATSEEGARPRQNYVVPGVLWWAFQPETAVTRGLGQDNAETLTDPNEGTPGAASAVVLLDEIDKADPDVPNDLLEPLGLYRFRTLQNKTVEAGTPPLIVITTNEERELPKAFLRRCVVHVLPQPTRARLRQIATVRFGTQIGSLCDDVVQAFAGTPTATAQGDETDTEQVDVSIAEFLDALAAARQLKLGPGHDRWVQVLAATTAKPSTVDLR